MATDIKYPDYRRSTTSNLSICDRTNLTILRLANVDDKFRDEVIQALNGYPKAVKALRAMSDDETGSLFNYRFVEDTLKSIGALDGN